MKEITAAKKVEVAQLYLLGHPYAEIEGQTGVSHGSIAGIVNEIGNGHLPIPGTPFDRASDVPPSKLGGIKALRFMEHL